MRRMMRRREKKEKKRKRGQHRRKEEKKDQVDTSQLPVQHGPRPPTPDTYIIHSTFD
jgi:hypothetical protein